MNLLGGAGQGVMLPTRQHDCQLHACTLHPEFLGRRRKRTLPFYLEDLKRLRILVNIIACLYDRAALLKGSAFSLMALPSSLMQGGDILLVWGDSCATAHSSLGLKTGLKRADTRVYLT